MSTVPTEHEILLGAIRSQLAQVNLPLPGTVVSYDRTNQTASVRLAVKFRREDPDTGEIVAYDPPVLSGAPVAFPSSGTFSITWDLAAGDAVLVLFSSRSLDEWASVIAAVHEPQDVRRFDLSDAIVYPGLRSPAAPLASTAYAAGAGVITGADIRLGSSAATLRPVLGSFETDLATWNAGFSTFLASLKTAASFANVISAATAMEIVHNIFVAQVTAGHQATKVKAE